MIIRWVVKLVFVEIIIGHAGDADWDEEGGAMVIGNFQKGGVEEKEKKGRKWKRKGLKKKGS